MDAAIPPGDAYEAKDVYIGLRERAFKTKPEDLKLEVSAQEPFGVVVDIGMDGAAVSLVIFKTGDASLYFSNGGGQLGGIGHESIRKAVAATLEQTKRQISRMQKTTSFPVVSRGQVRVYALTPGAIYSDAAPLDTVFESGSPARVIFSAIQDVITAFRQIEQK